MRNFKKDEQRIIVKILSKNSKREIDYDASSNEFIEKINDFYWANISEKRVQEAIKEAGIKILKEEEKIKNINKMFCNNCGKEISENSKFCNFCGKKVFVNKKKQNHVFLHDGEYHAWTCIYCDEKFKTKFELDEHKEICELNPKKENKLLIKDIEEKNMETTLQKNNKNAVIGFALSLISIFGVGLAGIIGMILGIVALIKIKYTHEKGKGLAIAAIIIGFIWGIGIGILKQLVDAGF